MYLPNTAFCTAFLANTLLLATPSLAAVGGRNHFKITPSKLDSYWVPSRNRESQYVLQMHRTPGRPSNAAYLQALRNGSQVEGVYGSGEVDLTDDFAIFATKVKIGGTTHELIIDTGSSDTWVPRSTFQCLSRGAKDFVPQANCQFASTYTPSPTFKPIDNQNFYVEYIDGESLQGTFGTERVTVAGITVKNQQIAVVDQAEWDGDTATGGVLGLAFPAWTNAFSGTDPSKNSLATKKVYNPVFTNMYTEGFVAPLFSIALDRDQGGQLAIGGLPPVDYVPLFASSPFQILTTNSELRGGISSTAYTLYVITSQGFTYDNSSAPQEESWSNWFSIFSEASDKSEVQFIVDTGTPFITIPAGTADAVNSLFRPAPLYKNQNGVYFVRCDATPPRFGVKIGFETFFINPKDMIIKQRDGRCTSGVSATGSSGANFLGFTFLKNVVAVFDVGAQMMRFAAREFY